MNLNGQNTLSEKISYYSSDNAGIIHNLTKMLNFGTLAGTGKYLILAFDQRFEHVPAVSFTLNWERIGNQIDLLLFTYNPFKIN